MTSATLSSNGRLPRKSLADQIDKLDSILDGLSEAIPEVIADSVRSATTQVVREAVSAAVKEVLSNPDLLRAALAGHAPTAPQPMPNRNPLRELLRRATDGLRDAAKLVAIRASEKLSGAWTRSLDALRNGCARLRRVADLARNLPGTLKAVGAGLWRFRRCGSIAVIVGAACAVGVYHAGPTIASVVSGFAGAALTAAGMVLLPLWRLITGRGHDA